jgi:hypothetical protein
MKFWSNTTYRALFVIFTILAVALTATAGNLNSSGKCPTSGTCILGNDTNSAIKLNTGSTTGDAAVVLPVGAIGSADILDGSILTTDIANGTIIALDIAENAIDADVYSVMSDKIVVCGQLIDAGHTNTWLGPAVAEYLGNGTEWAIGGTACNAYDSETNSAGADNPISADFPAFKVTGMQCILSSDPGNDVVITLHTATAVLVPSITCTVAGTGSGQGCSTVTSSTTDVAAGATISAAVVYSEDLDAEDAWCQVFFAVKAI